MPRRALVSRAGLNRAAVMSVLLFAPARSCVEDADCAAADAGPDGGEIRHPPSDVPCECDEPACGFCPDIEWVFVPGGRARIGCDDAIQDCDSRRGPPHEVTLSPYEMTATEVTNRVYRACLEAGACLEEEVWGLPPPGVGLDYSPVKATWGGMRRVCRWLGGDLPTNAQWEHAARGGQDGLNGEYWIWPWGNEYYTCGSCGCAVLNSGCGLGNPWPVASFPPTGLGFHDMIGNVSEWVLDWYCSIYEEWSLGVDPIGPPTDEDGRHIFKAHRGGTFGSGYKTIDSSAVFGDKHYLGRGGRCVRTPRHLKAERNGGQ